MKITILNGSPNGDYNTLTERIQSLKMQKENEGHSVEEFNLKEMDLAFCNGCWACWWKSPGICAIKDDIESILRSVINADLVIFSSPIIKGFTSSLLKKVCDRLIPLVHPYIELVENECHHLKRYDKYPDFALVALKEEDTDKEDEEIISDIFKRFALNIKTKVEFVEFI